MCGRYDNLIPRDAYGALFRAARIPRSELSAEIQYRAD